MPKRVTREYFEKVTLPQTSVRGRRSVLDPFFPDIVALVIKGYSGVQIHLWLTDYKGVEVSQRRVQRVVLKIRLALNEPPTTPAEMAFATVVKAALARIEAPPHTPLTTPPAATSDGKLPPAPINPRPRPKLEKKPARPSSLLTAAERKAIVDERMKSAGSGPLTLATPEEIDALLDSKPNHEREK